MYVDAKLPHGEFLAKGSWVWYMKATYGLPLGYCFDWLKAHETVPDWLGIIEAAVQDGMNPEKAIDSVCYEVTATWGKEEGQNVKQILQLALRTDRLTPLWDRIGVDSGT